VYLRPLSLRAQRIGYPVVLKAHAANVARARPELTLDGMLVEAMGKPGLELVVGAKRDPAWGTVLLAGLGGVRIAGLGDVALFAGGATAGEIGAGLGRLTGAALLAGTRGAPPVDVLAVAQVVERIGGLMAAFPNIAEIDVNPPRCVSVRRACTGRIGGIQGNSGSLPSLEGFSWPSLRGRQTAG
jgi:hypothetical protein